MKVCLERSGQLWKDPLRGVSGTDSKGPLRPAKNAAPETDSNQPNNPNNRANWLIINLYLAKQGLFTIFVAENKH